MRQSRNEAAYMIVACSTCLGLFHGIGLQVRALETVLVVGGAIGALLLLLLNLRSPRRLILAVIGVPLLVILSYGMMRGIFWYFMTYLPSTGEPLIKLGP